MHKLIARLIDCGMSREVALTVCRSFHGQMDELERYVESVEDECREPMETL